MSWRSQVFSAGEKTIIMFGCRHLAWWWHQNCQLQTFHLFLIDESRSFTTWLLISHPMKFLCAMIRGKTLLNTTYAKNECLKVDQSWEYYLLRVMQNKALISLRLVTFNKYCNASAFSLNPIFRFQFWLLFSHWVTFGSSLILKCQKGNETMNYWTNKQMKT